MAQHVRVGLETKLSRLADPLGHPGEPCPRKR
jgi:hypothetical protein